MSNEKLLYLDLNVKVWIDPLEMKFRIWQCFCSISRQNSQMLCKAHVTGFT